jgi:hypothetical protein
LGINPEPSDHPLGAEYNRKKDKRKISMTPSVRKHMVNYFGEELHSCADLFGGPAREWLRRYDTN